jgi:hypothetical protein
VIKISRLYQPRQPAFWVMLALNGLSTLLVWLIQNRPLSGFATAVVAIFALGNAAFGTWLAFHLMRSPPIDRQPPTS